MNRLTPSNTFEGHVYVYSVRHCCFDNCEAPSTPKPARLVLSNALTSYSSKSWTYYSNFCDLFNVFNSYTNVPPPDTQKASILLSLHQDSEQEMRLASEVPIPTCALHAYRLPCCQCRRWDLLHYVFHILKGCFAVIGTAAHRSSCYSRVLLA